MEIVLAYNYVQEVLELVTEYTDNILKQGKEVQDCLSSQHLEDEEAVKNRVSLESRSF